MLPQWRRNLYILFVVQLLTTAGFSLIFPFLPLYIKELGVATRGSLEFWAGMVFSMQALTMMISSPFWVSWPQTNVAASYADGFCPECWATGELDAAGGEGKHSLRGGAQAVVTRD